jgi:hypothetical protein
MYHHGERPSIRGAGVERCQRHVAAGINLPWAQYDLGRFHLLLGEPYEALDAYAAAIHLSGAEFMVRDALGSLERLTGTVGDRPGFEWARRLLVLALAAGFPSAETDAQVRQMASSDSAPLTAPVRIVAGGTDPWLEEQMADYSELLEAGFRDFEGTILSGGTKQGISGIVGAIGRARREQVRTVGYLPRLIPPDATPDPDYDDLCTTEGEDFSPMEPLQNWIDLIVSGVAPADVRVLGINGGRIAAAEYRIALALGATVGLVADSGLRPRGSWHSTTGRHRRAWFACPPIARPCGHFLRRRPNDWPDPPASVWLAPG